MVAELDQLRAKLSAQFAPRRCALWLVVAGLALAGCQKTSVSDSRETTESEGEGGASYSLDSALKIFRVGLEPIEELENGESSIEEIIDRLVTAVERRDTAELRALVMSRREFAYLYYPTSPFTRDPTKQEPGLVWFLHLQGSEKGATRLFNRYGGDSLRIIHNRCRMPPRKEGDNVLWDDCLQRIVEDGDTVVTRLFGGIYERHGRFKIFSYSNDL